MNLRVVAVGILCAVALTFPAAAQSVHVVNADPALVVRDMNNSLVAVGTASTTPFVVDSAGPRFFPSLHLRPDRLNNAGVIAGIWLDGTWQWRAFRVRADGTGYADTTFQFFPYFSASTPEVVRLTDSGLSLIRTSTTTMLHPSFPGSLALTAIVPAYLLWDGSQFAVVSTTYGLPILALVSDIGEDGMIGGSVDSKPFLQRPGEPRLHPWSGTGSVSKIGAGGHIVGHASAEGVIWRQPDGSLVAFPELTDAKIEQINRSGDFVGSYWNAGRARNEAFLVRGGQVVYLNESFNSPAEYLSAATDITDSGAVLATVAGVRPGQFRYAVLLALPYAPQDVVASVNERHVLVAWKPSAGATEYLVEAGSGPGLSDFFRGSSASQTSIAGVVPAGRYYVRIRARNLAGVSAPSTELVIDVP